MHGPLCVERVNFDFFAPKRCCGAHEVHYQPFCHYSIHSSDLNQNRHFSPFTAGAETCDPAVELLMQTFTAPGPRDLSLIPWSDRSKSVKRSFAPDAINLSYNWRCTVADN